MKTNFSSTSRHKGIKITPDLIRQQIKRVPCTAGLVIFIFSSLALLSILFQPRVNTTYAAVGEYSLWLPGIRPEPDLDLSGYLEVPYAPELNPSGGKITSEAWVKRNESDRNETVVEAGIVWMDVTKIGNRVITRKGTTSQLSVRPPKQFPSSPGPLPIQAYLARC